MCSSKIRDTIIEEKRGINMLIKCKECKTIYDNSEKYCPYCFTRTNSIVRYRSSVDGRRIEGSEMKKREKINDNYQKRCQSKFKNSKSNTAVLIATILIFLCIVFVVLVMSIIMFSSITEMVGML